MGSTVKQRKKLLPKSTFNAYNLKDAKKDLKNISEPLIPNHPNQTHNTSGKTCCRGVDITEEELATVYSPIHESLIRL